MKGKERERKGKRQVKGKERKGKGKGKGKEREKKGKGKYAVYLISRPMCICIFHNSFFPLKMHSNCESLNVFQPTELWRKRIIMEKIIMEKKRSRTFRC